MLSLLNKIIDKLADLGEFGKMKVASINQFLSRKQVVLSIKAILFGYLIFMSTQSRIMRKSRVFKQKP